MGLDTLSCEYVPDHDAMLDTYEVVDMSPDHDTLSTGGVYVFFVSSHKCTD